MYSICKSIIAIYLSLLPNPSTLAQQPVYTDPLGIEFVLIKTGNFVMGKFEPPYPKPIEPGNAARPSTAEKGYTGKEYEMAAKLAKDDSQPGFRVNINKPFYLGKYEITQAQWKKVMGNNPSIFQGNNVEDDASHHPVENVTWSMVQVFLEKLNAMNKGFLYRLPTEFEWEFAARAGAQDDISWSDIRLTAQLGARTTQPVGQKNPNAWGLYDMLGNVWEWVQDYYNEKIFADPEPLESGTEHVLKGASFVGDVKNATFMTHAAGPGNKWDIGFRIVMEVRQ